MPPKPASVELLLLGDLQLGRLVDDSFSFDPQRKEEVWGDWLEWVQERPDLLIAGNLECAGGCRVSNRLAGETPSLRMVKGVEGRAGMDRNAQR